MSNVVPLKMGIHYLLFHSSCIILVKDLPHITII